MLFLPKKFHLDERITLKKEETTIVEFVPIKRRRRGILFSYQGFQHLYEIDTTKDTCWELDCDATLVDKRPSSEVDVMEGNQLLSDGFMLVEIVETEQGYILSLLFHLMDVNVDHWIERDLNYVIKKIFGWYEDHRGIFEGGTDFLSDD